VVAQFPDHSVHRLFVRDNGATVTESAQVFLRDETGTDGIAKLTDFAKSPPRAPMA
jgi:hypothetical protein